ncbi:hypothetical protein IAT38_004106 [Cryptococcus sp. DSM 104549]
MSEQTPLIDTPPPQSDAQQAPNDASMAVDQPSAPPQQPQSQVPSPSPAPVASASTGAGPTVGNASAGETQEGERVIKVFNPAEERATPKGEEDLDETFFEPTVNDVRAHYAAVSARSKRLNEAPLLTSKFRDQDKDAREKAKKEKWPNTTIRIKFSDGTMIQSVFPSSGPIQPVYAFVRSSLRDDVKQKSFILWQPPRFRYPEHPDPAVKKPKPNPHKTNIIPPANYGHVRGGVAPGLSGGTGGNESLGDLGLVPQSLLVVKFDDEAMNASGYPAPLRDELKQKSEPLPPTVIQENQSQAAGPSGSGGASPKTEKKIPKWLQKGLMKKK